MLLPNKFVEDEKESETFKGGRNVGLKPYIICQLLRIDMPKNSRQVNPASVKVRVRRFFRPDDISEKKAYRSNIREVRKEYFYPLLLICLIFSFGICQVTLFMSFMEGSSSLPFI